MTITEDVALDVWLRIPDGEEEAEVEANTFREDDGTVRVEWHHTAVGVVSSKGFASYDAAREWLEAEGFGDYTTEGPTIMTQGTVEIADLIPEYERHLVYIDYRDQLTDEQVEEVIHDGWSESLDEWVSDVQWGAAWELAGELLERNPGLLYGRSDLAEEICEIDTSNPASDLASNTGMMLFRYSPSEDDMVWVGADTTAESLHAELGLADEFLPVLRDEIWPEIEGYTVSGGGFGATFLFSANPADVVKALNEGEDGRVVVHDPFLWLCNPWAGNGWGEVATGCTVTLERSQVHVDQCAWGYSAHDVFGGLALPDSTITPEGS